MCVPGTRPGRGGQENAGHGLLRCERERVRQMQREQQPASRDQASSGSESTAGQGVL